jgi:hypothetical protein
MGIPGSKPDFCSYFWLKNLLTLGNFGIVVYFDFHGPEKQHRA